MSAFLGPIHYWLYDKIQWHEALLEEIYSKMSLSGEDVQLIKSFSEHHYGAPERSELSEVIDGGNIHGWLQTKIQSLEYRMAYVITQALKNKTITLKALEILYRENGQLAFNQYQGELTTPQEVFKAIYDYLLEGMPCDRVNQPISADDDAMVWAKRICIHTEFWNAVKGDVKVFDALRWVWLEGFVGNEFELERLENDQFRLLRRTA